jgi:hypothetical protein
MGATVLQLAEVPPPLAEALAAKYDALVLPVDAGHDVWEMVEENISQGKKARVNT